MARRAAVAALPALLLAGALAASPVEEIDRFFRVNERVCTGGQPTTAQLASLAGEGIRTIIDLREPSEHDAEAERGAAAELKLRFVNIPVKTAEPRDEQVVAFLAATKDPEIFPAFIHCGSGNRVGAFWMIRRVLVDGWTEQKAEEEARRIGLRSPNLVEFARDYIRRHPKEN